MPLTIHIRHWSCWGHAPAAEKLKADLEAKYSDKISVTLESVAEPKGEFKVTIDGEVVHDKAVDNSGFASDLSLSEKIEAKL